MSDPTPGAFSPVRTSRIELVDANGRPIFTLEAATDPAALVITDQSGERVAAIYTDEAGPTLELNASNGDGVSLSPQGLLTDVAGSGVQDEIADLRRRLARLERTPVV